MLSPSLPEPLEPQHFSAPLMMAHEWLPPAARAAPGCTGGGGGVMGLGQQAFPHGS
ncbi:MAG: hypothetical protein U0235_23515 [Polyangiaceae bacterium]